jgi:xanthine dehydrogenase YagT iron-sulfur-binding subunit
MAEAKKGEASYVTADLRGKAAALQLSDEEIRERMSGNICRCGAYSNIVAAIREVHGGKDVAQAWQFVNENYQQHQPLSFAEGEKGAISYETV